MQLRYAPQWYRYFGGLADKIEGAVIPCDKPNMHLFIGCALLKRRSLDRVLSVIPFDDEEEAIAIANDSLYGLAAGIWTREIGRAIRVSERIRAGTIWVNTYRGISFMAPFGGYKNSGIGRECGQEAIRDYLQTKSVWVNLAEGVANPFVMR